MSGKVKYQRYIFKLRSGRLRRAGWKLTLPLSEARRNDEIIALADSQILDWIDELNGDLDCEEKAIEIRQEIRRLRNEADSAQGRRAVRKLYSKLDDVQFKPDYMCLIIDKVSDYTRACRGFTVNGIKYERLLGTNGGVKNHTIVFISERVSKEIKHRIENGRKRDVKLVPAKLEAYKALTCSASTPVSMPNGVLIVDDCVTEFKSDIIRLTDEESGEPSMKEIKDADVALIESDGYGLMLPSLAERWSNELGLSYIACGVNTRFAWEKGMVFSFDFLEFSDRVAKNHLVKDAWGNTVDIRDVELVLTTSMVKLWDSYDSLDDYLKKSLENKYSFRITKTTPKELESERTLNYQFIQTYELDDNDIKELTDPTVDEIKDILHDDVNKTLLFLAGKGLTGNAVLRMDDNYIKALMIDPEVINDPFIQKSIYQTIHKRITEAKVGVLNVRGNYSVVCGDPYSLCQKIFGLKVTGILKRGEIYNRYWKEHGTERLACFRAPMTCHNNIRLVSVNKSEEAEHWYQYLDTCTLFNSWDTAAHALNGMDKDGDLVMLTDNSVLVNKLKPQPALMCEQRKAEKKIVTEEDLIRSNIDSFGDDIGRTTNRITSMFEVKSRFSPDSPEYKALEYRIRCGQLYQQNAIDKAKGIIAKPMPHEWHDRHYVNKMDDDELSRFYMKIVADRKPYFMRYIYPALMREYNSYVNNSNKNAMRQFGVTLSELERTPEQDLSARQKDFLFRYRKDLPVGVGDCEMNRICRLIEENFDGYVGSKTKHEKFDYRVYKSGAEYSVAQYKEILKLYQNYVRLVKSYATFAKYERLDDIDVMEQSARIREEFIRNCSAVCQNRFTLCDIVLDICYQRNTTKRFAWEMCGREIIENMLNKFHGIISYPARDETGDIYFGGERFSMKSVKEGLQNE